MDRWRCHKVVEAGRRAKPADPDRFPVPRVVRSKGYRSKSAGAQAVSSNSFSDRELRNACTETVVESRGNTTNGSPAPAGSIGLAFALRARVVRGL